MPFRLEAAILSRIRSDVTSRSNWAKDRSTLRVSRHCLVGHGEAPVWSEGCNSSSSDRTRLLSLPTAQLAAAPYRASGLDRMSLSM